MELMAIVDKDGIMRDRHSKGLICVDPAILEQERVRMRVSEEKRHTTERLDRLENSVNDIKMLLEKLVNDN